MILIEFKLHNGKIPYFVKDYMSYQVEGKENLGTNRRNRYLGIARRDENNDEYLPNTVIRLTKEEFKTCLKSANIKESAGIEMKNPKILNDFEKEKIADNFIAKYNKKVLK